MHWCTNTMGCIQNPSSAVTHNHLAACKQVGHVGVVLCIARVQLLHGCVHSGLKVVEVLLLPCCTHITCAPQPCQGECDEKHHQSTTIFCTTTTTPSLKPTCAVGALVTNPAQLVHLPSKVELAEQSGYRFSQGHHKAGILEVHADALGYQGVGQGIVNGLCTYQWVALTMVNVAFPILCQLDRWTAMV